MSAASPVVLAAEAVRNESGNGSVGREPDFGSVARGRNSVSNTPRCRLGPVVFTPVSDPTQAALLAKLEEANRALEQDQKSLQNLSVTNVKQANGHSRSGSLGHSRKGSGSSIASVASNVSSLQMDEEATASVEDHWNAWGKLIQDWDVAIKKRPVYLKEMVRRGVPHHFRGIVWQLLSSAHEPPDNRDKYAEYLKMTSPCEKIIRRDITRTYPEHDFFKEKNGMGQESLFNVMKAYSLHDREVGYCQGSGFIVGLLLMQMPEEDAFAVLVKMMEDHRLRDLFKPSMAELGLCIFKLEFMIKDLLPELYNHFQAQNFIVSTFASSWFLTLFTTALPLSVACRVFDAFLFEGMEAIFRVSFTILSQHQNLLMSRDMEGMLRFLQREMQSQYEQDPDFLMNQACLVKFNWKKMKKLEKEYHAQKSKELEEQVELRRLRTENRLLRQRIDNLEKETETLANRLIQDQVLRAQKDEEMYVLKRQLSTLKTHDADMEKKFKDADAALHNMQKAGVEAVASERLGKLTSELEESRFREEETSCTVRQLREKIGELEGINRQLQQEPGAEIQQLQEELIACKLREAEANLAMKELRQTVLELQKSWTRHMEHQERHDPTGSNRLRETKLSEEVMQIKLSEAQAVAELKEVKQRVMELETQAQIGNRQLKRMDDDKIRLQTSLEEAADVEKDLQHKIVELQRTGGDVESKIKEDQMMGRIKDAEHSQAIAEMRQRIAELEIENQELLTKGELSKRTETEALEATVAKLQEQLQMSQRLHTFSSLTLNHLGDDLESEGEDLLTSSMVMTSSLMGSSFQRSLHAVNSLDESSDDEDNQKEKHTARSKDTELQNDNECDASALNGSDALASDGVLVDQSNTSAPPSPPNDPAETTLIMEPGTPVSPTDVNNATIVDPNSPNDAKFTVT